MRILVVHSHYRQSGGEDVVVESECELLRSKGHDVHLFEKYNDNVHGLHGAANSIWSNSARKEIREVILEYKPDIAHVHNVFHAISPGIYGMLAGQGIPVVQTLHNFRFFCIRGTFERGGAVCERCEGRSVWSGSFLKCYRGSLGASTVLAINIQLHRILKTFEKNIDKFIVLNEFCRQKFIRCGLPDYKLTVKPNYIDVEDPGPDCNRGGGLYVGRMATEKGIAVLAQALSVTGIPFAAIGSGPEENLLRSVPRVNVLAAVSREKVFDWMRSAEFLVMPSIWYETFGLVIIEAFASRLPVIASDIGAMAELVDDGKTGLLFKAGSALDLAEKLKWAGNHPEKMRKMGDAARARYEQSFTSDKNYDTLIEIYKKLKNAKD